MWCPQCQANSPLVAIGPAGLVCATCQTEMEIGSVSATSANGDRDGQSRPTSDGEARAGFSQVASPRRSSAKVTLRADLGHSLPNPSHHHRLTPTRLRGQLAMEPVIQKPRRRWTMIPVVASLTLLGCGQLLHLSAFWQHHRQSLIVATVMSVAAVCVALLYSRSTVESDGESLAEKRMENLSAPTVKASTPVPAPETLAGSGHR